MAGEQAGETNNTDDPMTDPPPLTGPDIFVLNRQIHIQSISGHYLSAADGGGGQVTVDRNEAYVWETFTVITHDSGLIGLRTSEGFFLSAEFGGGGRLTASRTNLGEWELFDPISRGGQTYAFRTRNGYYIVAEEGGGGAVSANRSELSEWETFTINVVN